MPFEVKESIARARLRTERVEHACKFRRSQFRLQTALTIVSILLRRRCEVFACHRLWTLVATGALLRAHRVGNPASDAAHIKAKRRMARDFIALRPKACSCNLESIFLATKSVARALQVCFLLKLANFDIQRFSCSHQIVDRHIAHVGVCSLAPSPWLLVVHNSYPASRSDNPFAQKAVINIKERSKSCFGTRVEKEVNKHTCMPTTA